MCSRGTPSRAICWPYYTTSSQSNDAQVSDRDEVATNTSGSIQTGQSQGMLVVMVLGWVPHLCQLFRL
jgi:hypothetical protein